ncbi:MAG: DUF2796 domain-containing protein [Dechloromonas sp.]|nr:DUF2796 domain-containing protein [Dechloromonas sp.]
MRSLVLLLGLILSLPVLSAPAHVHGEAKLEITIDGNVLAIHLESPLDGLLGFERVPRTAAEKQAVQAMKSILEQPDRLFQITREGECTALAPQIESPVLAAKPGDGHLDLDAEYRWQCAKPSALRDISTRLFGEFPRLKRITVEFVGPSGQKSGRLTAAQPRFAW